MALRRIAPVGVAALLAGVYLIVAPRSGDLAAHLLRAKLFSTEGFGIWNNWWYAGHPVVMYSLLFPAVAAALTPQLSAALATTATAALFEPLARRHFGPEGWVGATWFAAGAAASLFTGRLTFAFGLLPAVASVLALQRRQAALAAALALFTALCSPVAALFAAVAGVATAISGWPRRRRTETSWAGAGVTGAAVAGVRDTGAGVTGAAVAGVRDTGAVVTGAVVTGGALIPVVLFALAFPEGGSEPFAFSAFWPLPLIALGLALAIRREERALRAGAVLYGLVAILAYAIPSALGSNVTRLAELLAGPLAALVLWPRHKRLLLMAALPLLYVQWHAPVRDVSDSHRTVTTNAYYQPLISFLSRQRGGPFRIEIPFTKFHWEAYAIAPRFPLARGWERQLDIKYNHLFYAGRLTPGTYEAWLHRLAIRYVALPDAPLDYSAQAERKLIDRGVPYLRPVWRSAHWRVFAVDLPSPIVQPPARLQALGPNWFELQAQRPGDVLVRVHYTPYWAITRGSGCVLPAGQFTQLRLRRSGSVHVELRFALDRIRADSSRCSPGNL